MSATAVKTIDNEISINNTASSAISNQRALLCLSHSKETLDKANKLIHSMHKPTFKKLSKV